MSHSITSGWLAAHLPSIQQCPLRYSFTGTVPCLPGTSYLTYLLRHSRTGVEEVKNSWRISPRARLHVRTSSLPRCRASPSQEVEHEESSKPVAGIAWCRTALSDVKVLLLANARLSGLTWCDPGRSSATERYVLSLLAYSWRCLDCSGMIWRAERYGLHRFQHPWSPNVL